MPDHTQMYLSEKKPPTIYEMAKCAEEFALVHNTPNRSRSNPPVNQNPPNNRQMNGNTNKAWLNYQPPPTPPAPPIRPLMNSNTGRNCDTCGRNGHSSANCRVNQNWRRPDNPAQAKVIGAMTIETKPDSYRRHLSTGYIGRVGHKGVKKKIKILRDTGASVTAILREKVPLGIDIDAAERIWVKGVLSQPKRVPFCTIYLESDIISGPVKMCVLEEIPMDGVDILMGNELDNSLSAVRPDPPREPPPVATTAAITRSKSRQMPHKEEKEDAEMRPNEKGTDSHERNCAKQTDCQGDTPSEPPLSQEATPGPLGFSPSKLAFGHAARGPMQLLNKKGLENDPGEEELLPPLDYPLKTTPSKGKITPRMKITPSREMTTKEKATKETSTPSREKAMKEETSTEKDTASKRKAYIDDNISNKTVAVKRTQKSISADAPTTESRKVTAEGKFVDAPSDSLFTSLKLRKNVIGTENLPKEVETSELTNHEGGASTEVSINAAKRRLPPEKTKLLSSPLLSSALDITKKPKIGIKSSFASRLQRTISNFPPFPVHDSMEYTKTSVASANNPVIEESVILQKVEHGKVNIGGAENKTEIKAEVTKETVGADSVPVDLEMIESPTCDKQVHYEMRELGIEPENESRKVVSKDESLIPDSIGADAVLRIHTKNI